jgi:putative sterol carrier protein
LAFRRHDRRNTGVRPQDKERRTMSDNLKFFSQEWCDAAIAMINTNEVMYKGFKDPATFTNKMEFGCIGREDVACHLEWEKAKVVSWTPRKFDEGDLWLVINGSLETWRKVASGDAEGGKLLLAGKVKFAKGPMSAAIENAGAFNAFLLAWGQVPTDWDV